MKVDNQCPLCKSNMILVNEHHIIPQATGGSMGPTVNICALCHDALHQCSIKVLAGNTVEANHIADNIFVNKKLAQELIQSIIQATLRKKEGQVSEKDFNYKLILALPGNSKKYLKIMAKERKLSIVNFIMKLILQEIKKNFPDFKGV